MYLTFSKYLIQNIFININQSDYGIHSISFATPVSHLDVNIYNHIGAKMTHEKRDAV